MSTQTSEFEELKQGRKYSDTGLYSPTMMSPATSASNSLQEVSPTKLKIHLKNDSKFVQEQFLKANQLLQMGRSEDAYNIIEMLIYKEDISFEYNSGDYQYPPKCSASTKLFGQGGGSSFKFTGGQKSSKPDSQMHDS